MALRLLSLVAALTPSILADVDFVTPAAGVSYAAGATIPITFKESGVKPPITDLTNYVVQLCAGGSTPSTYTCLTPLVPSGSFAAGNTATGVTAIPAAVGATSANGYFLMITSTGPGANIQNFSPRFGLTGMTGTFAADIVSAIAALGTSTEGPPTVDVQLPDQSDSTALSTSTSSSTSLSSASMDYPASFYAIPYVLQTGPTRFAPMQPRPGTSISVTALSRQFPTSAATIAKSFLPTPYIQTTVTQNPTITYNSLYNTAPAAPFANEAHVDSQEVEMKRWLNRWKD